MCFVESKKRVFLPPLVTLPFFFINKTKLKTLSLAFHISNKDNRICFNLNLIIHYTIYKNLKQIFRISHDIFKKKNLQFLQSCCCPSNLFKNKRIPIKLRIFFSYFSKFLIVFLFMIYLAYWFILQFFFSFLINLFKHTLLN